MNGVRGQGKELYRWVEVWIEITNSVRPYSIPFLISGKENEKIINGTGGSRETAGCMVQEKRC